MGLREILPARNGALAALASQVPPTLLADEIGLSLSGASMWTKAIGAARGEYAGLRHNQVEVTEFTLGQPSLNEVFLALTGHPATADAAPKGED